MEKIEGGGDRGAGRGGGDTTGSDKLVSYW